MKFPTNTFKRAIVQNKSPKQVGLWISMCSNYAAEVISGADNLNWVCIDNEHSPNDIKSTMLLMDLPHKFTTQNEGNIYSLIIGPLENLEANNLVLSFISKGYKKTEFILE